MAMGARFQDPWVQDVLDDPRENTESTLGKIQNPFIKEACEPRALQWSCAASGALQIKLTLRKPHIRLKYPYVIVCTCTS